MSSCPLLERGQSWGSSGSILTVSGESVKVNFGRQKGRLTQGIGCTGEGCVQSVGATEPRTMVGAYWQASPQLG